MNILFSETIKKLRIEKGLSQQELASMLFITRSTIAKWENGDRIPDVMTISKLAEIFGVDINFLLSASSENHELQNIIMVDDRKLILTGGLPVLKEVFPNAIISGFTNVDEAIEYTKSNRVSLAFLDIELRNASGFDLCKSLLSIYPRTNVIFLTAYADYSLDAWNTGASGFMLKPITVSGVKEQLEKLRYPFFVGGENK